MKPAIALSLLSALLLAAAPTALAGTAEEPEVVDAALDAMPPVANAYGDVTKAWFEAPGDGVVRLVMEVSLLPPEQNPAIAYAFVFEADGAQWFGGFATVPLDGFFVGGWDAGSDGPSGMDEATGEVEYGPGGRVSVDFPLSRLPGGVARLEAPRVVTIDIKGDVLPVGGFALFLDEAASDAVFPLPGAAAPEPVEPAAAAPEAAEPADVGAAPAEAPKAVPFPAGAALVAALGAAWLRRRA